MSLATPWLFTALEAPFSSLDFTETGQIGDTIGGITAPFLSLVGSVLVFLSFRAQIEMNRVQFTAIQKQFQKMDEDKLKERLNEMQNVIDVINDKYVEQFDGIFRRCQNYLIDTSRCIEKYKFDYAIKLLNKTYFYVLQLEILVHLKELVEIEENNNSNQLRLNFIKIQIDMILKRINFMESYPEIIRVIEKLEADLKNKNKYDYAYEILQKIDSFLSNILNLNAKCERNGTINF